MSGVKGRSGRKSWDKELASHELWDLSIPVLKHALKSETLPIGKKVDVALALFSKMAPSEIKGDGIGQRVDIFNIGEIDPDARRGLIEILRARRGSAESTLTD